MSEVESKREQAREERRRQILEAALGVFSRKGFHAANVSDVAAEAGVSQGTIYWYFESKEELLNAALLSFFVDFSEQTFRALEGCETAEEKLRCLGRSLEVFPETVEGLFALFLSYWSSSERRDEVAQMWVELLVEYKDLVVEVIEDGVQSGEFQPVDAESLVWAIMGAYDGVAAYGLLMPDLDVSRINDAFVGTVISGLKAGTGIG
jgi:AcrR family transcriptional regulator